MVVSGQENAVIKDSGGRGKRAERGNLTNERENETSKISLDLELVGTFRTSYNNSRLELSQVCCR
jgi:hypothetical protein